jgi:transcriptional regulator with XRE-family HTH domain
MRLAASPVRRTLLMGTYARRRPERLAEKLLAVREAFGDSQNGLIRRLGLEDEITQSDLSAFERGTREPPLHILLRYSELARVWVNALIDDGVDLPEKMPGGKMREGVTRTTPKRRGRR